MNTATDNAQGLREALMNLANDCDRDRRMSSDEVDAAYCEVADNIRDILATHLPQQVATQQAPLGAKASKASGADGGKAGEVPEWVIGLRNEIKRAAKKDSFYLSRDEVVYLLDGMQGVFAAPAAPATPESAEPVAWAKPADIEKLRARGLGGARLGIYVTDCEDEDCSVPIFTPAASDGGLREALLVAAVRHADRSCPCGARGESPETHPHMPGCPVGAAMDVLATPQASTPAAVAPEQVTDAELRVMFNAYDADEGTVPDGIRAAGNALLALRAAQQKGGGQ